jgi:hypothetical protein
LILFFFDFLTFSRATTVTQINKTIETGTIKNQVNPSRKPSGSPGMEPSSLRAIEIALEKNISAV